MTEPGPVERLRTALAVHPNATYVRVEVIDLKAALDARETLDVDRLAVAINSGSPIGLDDKDEWYTSPRAFAEEVAAWYARGDR